MRCVHKTYNIFYRQIESARHVTFQQDRDRLLFYGATHDFSLCTPFLIRFLKMQAKIQLGHLLNQLSTAYEMPYQQLSIRSQKTLWGSCSSDANIQLNYKILFLPESVAHYILVHELCHTIHLNHSKKFWQNVARFVPDFAAQRAALHDADQWVPKWIVYH